MSPLNITQPLGILVYNGYYKVMSNIPKMGQLPTPVDIHRFFWNMFLFAMWFGTSLQLAPHHGHVTATICMANWTSDNGTMVTNVASANSFWLAEIKVVACRRARYSQRKGERKLANPAVEMVSKVAWIAQLSGYHESWSIRFCAPQILVSNSSAGFHLVQ